MPEETKPEVKPEEQKPVEKKEERPAFTPIGDDEIALGLKQDEQKPVETKQEEKPQPQEKPAQAVLDDLFPKEEPKDEKPTVSGDPDEGGDEEEHGESLPKKLREQLAERKREIQKLAEEKEQVRKQYEEQLEQIKSINEKLQKELSIQDPAHDPEVQKVSGKFDETIANIARQIGEPGPARRFMENAKALIDTYSELGDVYSEGYEDRYREFRGQIEKLFGEKSVQVMQALPQLDALKKDLQSAVEKANGSSVEARLSRAFEAHQKSAKALENVIKETLVFNEEIAEAEPFSTQNVIARMRDASKEFSGVSTEITKFLRNALVPPKPLDPRETAGLTDEQKRELENKRMAGNMKAQQDLYRIVPLAVHAFHALPFFARELAEAKRKLAEIAGSLPPATGGEAKPAEQKQDENKGDLLPSGVRPITIAEISPDM